MKQEILVLEREFEMAPNTGLPSGKILDGISLQAGLAVLPFVAYTRSNKNNTTPFNPCRAPAPLVRGYMFESFLPIFSKQKALVLDAHAGDILSARAC